MIIRDNVMDTFASWYDVGRYLWFRFTSYAMLLHILQEGCERLITFLCS